MSDPILEGMLLGTMDANITKDVQIASLEKTVEKLETLFETERQAHMRTIASRDGFMALSNEIVKELADPAKPRYLSDPRNREARQKFFDEKRDRSYQEIKAKNT